MQPEKCGRMPACVLEGSVSAAREVWQIYGCMTACVLTTSWQRAAFVLRAHAFFFLQEHFEELLEFMSRCISAHCMLHVCIDT